MGSGCVIHCNAGLVHQVSLAKAWAAGFHRHGVACEITDEKHRPGEMHLCMGPWWALPLWQTHPRCIHVDRAFWGDPECVSVGWAQPDGSRAFPTGEAPRDKPPVAAYKRGRDAIVLADYGDTGESLACLLRPHVDSLTIRRHPAEGGRGKLAAALAGKHIAIGERSTALIEAAVLGLAVICRDPRNPVMPVASSSHRDIKHADRTDWLHGLSWANWSHDEIASGDCWAWLSTRSD